MSLVVALLLLLDEWSKASGAFKAALQGSDDKKVESAVVDVASDNSARASKLLLQGLTTTNPTFYWLIVRGLSRITNAEGVAAIADAVLAKTTPPETKRDLLMPLQLNDSPAANEALLRIVPISFARPCE